MEKKYSVIVFDLGNVLIPFNYNTALAKLEKIQKGLGERFWGYYMANYELHRDFERGNIAEEVFINKMLNVLEGKIDSTTFCELYSKVFREDREVSSLLPILKKKFTLILLSNTNSIHMEFGWKDYDFLKHFDGLILSHQIKSVKPEEKIYRSVEMFTRKPPEEHFFIDDIEEYVLAAKKQGWDGVVFRNAFQLKHEFIKRGIIA